MRKITYITGTRADFGLMFNTLKAINANSDMQLDIVVTGMHLSASHGMTINEVKASGFTIRQTVSVDLEPYSGATMAKNIGHMLTGFVTALENNTPDLVLLLGDRGEMLAGALAAIHLNVHVAHIHGGERSGTVDELVRHAISKLSHFHFTATENARERLLKMGENPENIYTSGAPGIDGINVIACYSRNDLAQMVQLDSEKPIALFIYHPVLQETEGSGKAVEFIIAILRAKGVQMVTLMPNSNAGSQAIRDVLEQEMDQSDIAVLDHLSRDKFLSWMKQVDVMVGNSSAGIIESGSFGTPVINIGMRQNLRERNNNVLDIMDCFTEFATALDTVLSQGRFATVNIYGDGQAAMNISSALVDLPLTNAVLLKTNVY